MHYLYLAINRIKNTKPSFKQVNFFKKKNVAIEVHFNFFIFFNFIEMIELYSKNLTNY